MGKNNGSGNHDSSNGGIIDINEYLRQQGHVVPQRPDTTGFVGGMPADVVVSSDFFRKLDEQNLASSLW